MTAGGLHDARQSLLSAWALSHERILPDAPLAAPWGQPAGWRGGIPAPDQELLLKAALLPDQRGRKAWHELSPRLDLDTVDGAAWPVLPMLVRNLAVLDPETELMPRLRGIRRFLWAQNQLVLGELMPLVGLLESASVSTVILKGGAMVPFLEDPGLRPIGDLDVLVPEDARGHALDVLTEAGLVPFAGVSRAWVDWVLEPSTPGYALCMASGRELDLHWHAMHQSRQAGADSELWAAAREVEIAGVHTRVPDPADQLLHAICHAMSWDQRPSYRWVVDAWLLLSQPLDYVRLVAQARRRRLTVALHAGLAYLDHRFEAPIPPDVIRELRRGRGSLLERAEYRARARAPHERTLAARAVLDHQSQVRRQVAPEAALTPIRRLRVVAASLAAGDPGNRDRPPVPLGSPVRFGHSDAPGRYVVRGMGLPDDGGCWTVGREARLTLPITGPPGAARLLTLRCSPYVNEAHPNQRLEVIVNGHAVAGWTARHGQHRPLYRVALPPSVTDDEDRLDLRLRTPDARSPRTVCAGDDGRQLGWFIEELTISAVEDYELGTALGFGTSGSADRYLAGQWWPPDEHGRWTADGAAGLLLRVDRAAADLRLELDAVAVRAMAGRRAVVRVRVNGHHRKLFLFGRFTARVPKRAGLGEVRAGDEIALSLDVVAPVAPSKLGLSEDPRPLGIHLRRLVLVPAQGRGRG